MLSYDRIGPDARVMERLFMRAILWEQRRYAYMKSKSSSICSRHTPAFRSSYQDGRKPCARLQPHDRLAGGATACHWQHTSDIARPDRAVFPEYEDWWCPPYRDGGSQHRAIADGRGADCSQ